MAVRKRIPLIGTLPTIPTITGIKKAFLGALFAAGILQGVGVLENATILGVP